VNAIREALIYLLRERAVLFFDDYGNARNVDDANEARKLIGRLEAEEP